MTPRKVTETSAKYLSCLSHSLLWLLIIHPDKYWFVCWLITILLILNPTLPSFFFSVLQSVFIASGPSDILWWHLVFGYKCQTRSHLWPKAHNSQKKSLSHTRLSSRWPWADSLGSWLRKWWFLCQKNWGFPCKSLRVPSLRRHSKVLWARWCCWTRYNFAVSGRWTCTSRFRKRRYDCSSDPSTEERGAAVWGPRQIPASPFSWTLDPTSRNPSEISLCPRKDMPTQRKKQWLPSLSPFPPTEERRHVDSQDPVMEAGDCCASRQLQAWPLQRGRSAEVGGHPGGQQT